MRTALGIGAGLVFCIVGLFLPGGVAFAAWRYLAQYLFKLCDRLFWQSGECAFPLTLTQQLVMYAVPTLIGALCGGLFAAWLTLKVVKRAPLRSLTLGVVLALVMLSVLCTYLLAAEGRPTMTVVVRPLQEIGLIVGWLIVASRRMRALRMPKDIVEVF